MTYQCPICSKYHPHTHDAEQVEWEAALRRAFVDRRMDCIGVDGRTPQNLREAARYGVFKGWLSEKETGSDEAQYTELVYTLTPFGSEHFATIPPEPTP